MKKLFTLVALLACFLGVNAEEKVDYTVDYSSYNGFPFYVMGYVPEWVGGVMTDFGGNYEYVKVADDAEKTSDVIVSTNDGTQYYKITKGEGEGTWHQYFIADGIKTGDLADVYFVKAMVKASEAVTLNINMGWGWGDGQQKGASVTIPQSSDFVEVEWQYSGIEGSSCNLVAQPASAATIEWKSLVVYHNQKQSRPTVWKEWLTSDGEPVVVTEGLSKIPTYMGNAETPWADATVKFNDQEKNYLICAWSKEKGRNLNEDGGWDPFPADITTDPDEPTNKVFICHGQPATTEGDASAWDNQFWIESPKQWKEGDQVKVHFRYRCNKASVTTQTQIHNQNPSDYLVWHAIGEITFTNQWQEFDDVMTIGNDMAGGWSIAFNLNPNDKDAIDFYFDDLSWQTMVLDEGFFVAGANPEKGLAYNFDEAVEFVDGVDPEGEACLVATVGTSGDEKTYVSQIMISTIRGNDAAFKSNTLKAKSAIVDLNEDDTAWIDYEAGSNAKISLPGSGVWKIYLDPSFHSLACQMLEGEAIVITLEDVVTNSTEVVVNALERDWKPAKDDGTPQDGEEGIGEGQPWDNQFWLIANRVLNAGEVTVVKFKYKATKDANVSTQTHGNPGAYIHWAAIGGVNFKADEWQDFETTFTVPSEAKDGMKSIAFNLSEIKAANDYYFKDFQWYLQNDTEGKTTENLINATGGENFAWKIKGGDIITGISTVASKKNVGSAVIYNLAGQRVSNGFKGIVVKDGKKYVK